MRTSRTRIRTAAAFSLLEVMIAMAIFFMCVFSILAMVSRGLSAARSLEPVQIDASSLAAELSVTNRLEEGTLPPEIIEHFQKMYPNYTCEASITEVRTNGLFEVKFMVGGMNAGKRVVASESTILLWRPMSAPGARSR